MLTTTGKIKTLPPAIVKSKEGPLWSGKQIISTIVVNLTPEGKPPPTLYSSAKIKPALFEKAPRRKWRAGGQLSGAEMSEAEVIFRGGEFLSGRDGRASNNVKFHHLSVINARVGEYLRYII